MHIGYNTMTIANSITNCVVVSCFHSLITGEAEIDESKYIRIEYKPSIIAFPNIELSKHYTTDCWNNLSH